MARSSLILAGAFVATVAMALAQSAAAQTPAQKPAPGQGAAQAQDPKQAKAAAVAAGQKAYASGTKLYEAGKYKDAIPQLTMALAAAGLPSQQMAKALYYRGIAHRKLGKPAQAMSDLTTAIWVSGGLSDADRASAIDNRQAAYREAGLGDEAPPLVNTAPAPALAAATPAPAAPAAAPAPEPAAVSAGADAPPPAVAVLEPSVPAPAPATAPEPAFGATVTPAPAPAKVAVAEPASGIPNPFADPASAQGAPPAPAAAPAAGLAPEPAPAAAADNEPSMLAKAGKSLSEAGTNVTNFFGNMFKGSSGSPEPAASAPPAPTFGVEAQTSASPVLTAANPDGAIGADWGGATQVKSGGTGTRVAAAQPAPMPSPISTGAVAQSAAAPAKPLSGKYVLQIGAVRNRPDADALADRVRREHGASLGGREPVVDEAVIGNFGSFHRVRIGPYADAKEPGKFCSTLIKAGYDCLVVTP